MRKRRNRRQRSSSGGGFDWLQVFAEFIGDLVEALFDNWW